MSATISTGSEIQQENKTFSVSAPILTGSTDADLLNAEIDQLNKTMKNNQANISQDINTTAQSTVLTSTVPTITTSTQNLTSTAFNSIVALSTVATINQNSSKVPGIRKKV